MGQLVTRKNYYPGEFYAGNNTFICRPGDGDGVYCPRHGDLIPDPKTGVRWRQPVIAAAIVMTFGAIVVSLIQQVGAIGVAYWTHAVADRCQAALPHYKEAENQEALSPALEDHIKRFPDCDYVDQARIKLAFINRPAPTTPPAITIIPKTAPAQPAALPQQNRANEAASLDQLLLDSAMRAWQPRPGPPRVIAPNVRLTEAWSFFALQVNGNRSRRGGENSPMSRPVKKANTGIPA